MHVAPTIAQHDRQMDREKEWTERQITDKFKLLVLQFFMVLGSPDPSDLNKNYTLMAYDNSLCTFKH